jgi:hypothetical protein
MSNSISKVDLKYDLDWVDRHNNYHCRQRHVKAAKRLSWDQDQ